MYTGALKSTLNFPFNFSSPLKNIWQTWSFRNNSWAQGCGNRLIIDTRTSGDASLHFTKNGNRLRLCQIRLNDGGSVHVLIFWSRRRCCSCRNVFVLLYWLQLMKCYCLRYIWLVEVVLCFTATMIYFDLKLKLIFYIKIVIKWFKFWYLQFILIFINARYDIAINLLIFRYISH